MLRKNNIERNILGGGAKKRGIFGKMKNDVRDVIRKRGMRPIFDAAIVIAIVLLVSLPHGIANITKKVHGAFSSWERFDIDELIVTILAIALCLVWYQSRRTRESFISLLVRKKAEELLWVNEVHGAALEDQMELICRWLPSGELTDVNDAYCRFFGRSRDALTGKSFLSLVPEGDQKTIKKNMNDINPDNNVVSYDHRVIAWDGKLRWVRWTTRAIFNTLGRILELQSVGRDVTEQKMAEEKLKNSEERLNILFEFAPEAYFLNDLRGRFVDGNKAAEKLFGYSKKQLLGKNFLTLDLLPKDQIPIMTRLLDQNAMGHKTEPQELTVKHSDGSEVIVEISTFPVVVEGTVLMLNIARNITERKKMEGALTESKNIAEIANRAKSDFLANMSHELRTPLNAIIGFSEVLKDEAFGPLTEKQKEYINDVWESGKHLLAVINDVLDLSKIEAGKMQLDVNVVDLKNVIRSGVSLLREKAKEHNIKVVENINDDVGMVEADERKVKQVLFNLLSNALKFTPDGGKIGIDAQTTKTGIMISVWDTGIGIEEHDKERIFKEFERIDNLYSREYQGTGLGLYIAKGFVERHGGKMWVESKGKNKGSKFIFTIPS